MTAQRLVAVQVQKQKWRERPKSFQCEKKQITDNEGLDDYAKQEGINLLSESYFSVAEQRRVFSLAQDGLIERCDA